MKWKNKGHEFDEVAKEVLKEGYGFYLWGAGIRGKTFYDSFKGKLNIIGFLDSNIDIQKNTFCGLPVYAPKTILEKKSPVVRIIVTSM